MNRTAAIPGNLNLLILTVSVAVLSACLWLASQQGNWLLVALAAITFSFFSNTMYSLMHEAVHQHFHANALVNEIAGCIIAGFFPTAFSLQRVFHLAHHKNNRSEHERFDYYAPGDNILLKRVQWYCILTGLYWIALPLASVVYLLVADLIRWRSAVPCLNGGRIAKQTSAEEFLEALAEVSISRARFDVLVSIAVQLSLVWALDLTLFGWLICYAAFALNWSSLQYADHAFSPLHEKEGAWNLRVPAPVRWVFLNYHYHLVHHRDPSLCWTQLPAHKKSGDPSPSFWSIYRKMWAGPRPLPLESRSHH